MLEKTRSSRGLRDRMVAWTSVATMVATLWSSQLAIAATLFPAPQEEPPPAPQAPCVCDEPGTSVEGAEAPSVEFLAPDVSFSVAPDDVAFDAPTLTYSVAPTAPTAPTFFTESVAPDAAHVLGSYARPGAIGRGAFVGSGAVCDRRIGVKLKRVGAELASHLGVSSDETLLVDAVAKGSPAAAAGVKRHDVLVSVDGHAPVTVESLRAAVRGKAVGDEIRLGLIRRGERIFVEVEVSDWRGDGLWSQPLKPGPTAIAPRLGLGAGVSKLKLPRKLAEPNIPKKLGRARGFVLPTAPRGKGRRRGSDDDEKELRRAIESLEKTRRSLQKYIDRLERELKEAERDANRPSQRQRRTRSRRVTRSTESDVETLKRRMNGRLSGAPLQADPEAAS